MNEFVDGVTRPPGCAFVAGFRYLTIVILSLSRFVRWRLVIACVVENCVHAVDTVPRDYYAVTTSAC
jgi:hypothetical protein